MGSELDNTVPVNAYDMSELTTNDKQPLVANALGRTALIAEFVYLSGYFGDVTDQDGIATGSSGRINIDADRTIRTEQMEATDTFVVGNTLWFVAGGAGAAGTLEDANTGTDYAAGIITGFGGTAGAHTYVEFRPFAQRLDAADVSAQVITNTADIATNTAAIGTLASLTTTEKTNLVGAVNEVDADVLTLQGEMLVEQAEPKILVQDIVADASAGIVITGLVAGDEILGMSVVCKAANANGTFVLEQADGTDITDGVICAVDTAQTYSSNIVHTASVLPAGAQIISVGGTAANTRGKVAITYIPA